MKQVFKNVWKLLLCGMVAMILSACDKDKNNDPKPDGDKDKTEEVVTPTDPENPDTPDNPTNPDNPNNPDNPVSPDDPTNPDNPDVPSNPYTPPTLSQGPSVSGNATYGWGWATFDKTVLLVSEADYQTTYKNPLKFIVSFCGKGLNSVDTLQPNTTYYYRPYTTLSDGTYQYGEVQSFTTASLPTKMEMVDLGVGVKWASCNLGASKPTDYGDYYAWGETTTKSEYTEENSVTYGIVLGDLKNLGVVDSNGNLTAQYDAATQKLGAAYRMPTKAEFDKLKKNCRWVWRRTVAGVSGYLVRGGNNAIFLPAANYRYGSGSLDVGSDGLYWSSTAHDDNSNAYYLYFYSSKYDWYHYSRYYGFSVRAVMD